MGGKSARRFGGRGIFKRNKTRIQREDRGPAECTVPELQEHYFDCAGYNEADRFLNTKKAIVQYLGQQFGGDVTVTLQSGELFRVPVPHDPADDREDDVDSTGAIIKTARQKVPYVAAESFKKEIAEYVKRKKTLQKDLEKAFAIVFGQCTYALQQKLEAH